jgi:threonine/homoserine/homoserine lactone efflux protein
MAGRLRRWPAGRATADPLLGLLTTSFLVGISGALMPGPLFAAVVAGAVAAGFWAGPALVLGHGLLELALVLALSQGLGRVLRHHGVTRAIAAVGGLTLLWLAAGMIQDGLAQRVAAGTAAGGGVLPSPVIVGAAVSASNPYWWLWWATIGTTYLALALQHGAGGLASFFTGHILSDLAWYSFVALAVAAGRDVLGPRVYNGVVVAAGAFLCVMALVFLRAALWPRRLAAASGQS